MSEHEYLVATEEDAAADLGPADATHGAADPFHPDNIGVVQLITLMRILDVLTGIYKELEPTKARQLLDAHYNGDIVGSFPRLSGKFITDIVNSSTAELTP